MFDGLFNLIAGLLNWFYSLWPSYGMAIIFLTIVVMLVMAPLTISSTRQMIRMQRLQPELKRIQNEFRHDRQRMNEEVMRFYQANNVNPVGSCLPMFIQMPVFLILFRVLRGLTRRLTDVGFQVGAVTGQLGSGSDTHSVAVRKMPFDPDHLGHSTDLYQSLQGRTKMVSWGLDLSASPVDMLGDSFLKAIPYLLMLVAIAFLSWYQQKQIQGRRGNTAIPAQQQAIMKILPFMLPAFSFAMQGGLLVYFIVSALVRIAQQHYITKVIYGNAQDQPIVPAQIVDTAATKKSSSKSDTSSRPAAGASSSSARRRRTTAGERAREEARKNQAASAPKPSRPAEVGTSRRTTAPGSRSSQKKKRK